jgi:hypothetical protein
MRIVTRAGSKLQIIAVSMPMSRSIAKDSLQSGE